MIDWWEPMADCKFMLRPHAQRPNSERLQADESKSNHLIVSLLDTSINFIGSSGSSLERPLSRIWSACREQRHGLSCKLMVKNAIALRRMGKSSRGLPQQSHFLPFTLNNTFILRCNKMKLLHANVVSVYLVPACIVQQTLSAPIAHYH